LYILYLNTLIYLHELGDLAKSNLVIHILAILSRMPLVEANLVIHISTILARMPLAEANLVFHIPAILSRMPLAEANLVFTLDFIYTEHDIYCNYIHHKNSKLYKCK
jgi:hypothetical protein